MDFKNKQGKGNLPHSVSRPQVMSGCSEHYSVLHQRLCPAHGILTGLVDMNRNDFANAPGPELQDIYTTGQ